MKKKVYLCIPTLSQYHMLNLCMDSAEAGTLVPDHYIIMDNGGEYVTIQEYEYKKTVIKPGRNLGCAASWNYFINNYLDNDNNILIIANDDIEFFPDSIEKLVNTYYSVMNNPYIGIIGPHGNAGNLYSCFILNKGTVAEVGLFDEQFYPAYYEDCDYDYRMRLIGREAILSLGCSYLHHHSATLKGYNEEQLNNHHSTFTANKNYYRKKWGGDKNSETFTVPFGQNLS